MQIELDWATAWSRRLANSTHRVCLAEAGVSTKAYWDNFGIWPELQTYTGYPGRILDRLKAVLSPEDTVLDIGAGSGALTIPLAGIAKAVTALEPSPRQIARLRQRAGEAGLTNIVTLQKTWQEAVLDEMPEHDVVTAGYCLQYMDDITEAIEKAYRAARKALFLVHFVDHDLIDTLRGILGGRDLGPDYIYLYNVLYQLGYRANVEIIARDYEMPLALQLENLRYTYRLNEGQLTELTACLEGKGSLLWRDGESWVKRRYRDGLIWMMKEL